MNRLFRALLVLAMSAGVMSGAAASPVYTKVVGTSLDFYYLADSFGGAKGFALGDTLMLEPPRGFHEVWSVNAPEVVAVAHSGHALTGGGGIDMQGYFSVWSDNSMLRTDGYFKTMLGSFSNGAFAPTADGNANVFTGRMFPSPGHYNDWWHDGSAMHRAVGEFSTVAMYGFYVAYMLDYGHGSYGEVGISALMYNFDQVAVPLPAVPEPQTYAMLLAGLALVGAGARRRLAARPTLTR